MNLSIFFLFVITNLNKFINSGIVPSTDGNGITSPSSNSYDMSSIHFPAEPLNPGDYAGAKTLEEDKNRKSSSVYENEHQVTQSFLLESMTRNGLVDERKRWPKIDGTVYIPYLISNLFDSRQRQIIAKAFENFESNTCIRFIPRMSQRDYINIYKGKGCDSDAGRKGGEQTLSLGPGCEYTDTAIHELNHAVGFWHEQNRPDRDAHVTVYLENVIPENRFNFDKMSPRVINTFGVAYDTYSIMHYDKYAFSKDPSRYVVMEPKVPNKMMGLVKTLSKSDILRINRMYKCFSRSNLRSDIDIDDALSYQIDGDSCNDFHSNCTMFSKHAEQCETNLWMRVNCRETCNICHEKCEDINENCSKWALDGACTKYPQYMRLYCSKSCRTCNN